MLKILNTSITDVKVIVPQVFPDERGFFFESYHANHFAAVIGEKYRFVQDNHSHSTRHVVRGLHYQIQQPQGKLVRVISGEIYDVALDMRKSSSTFGHWVSAILNAENRYILWVPPHFAHGFMVMSESADLLYKTTDYYAPEHERCILWNDPELAITWPQQDNVVVSHKDSEGTLFKHAEVFA